MAYVVTGPCIGCKCGSCAEMCPVDAFREGEMMLYIDPEVCIDCDACRQHCLRGGIFSENDVPDVWENYRALNAQESVRCPPITTPQQPIGFPVWECRANRPQVDLESVA